MATIQVNGVEVRLAPSSQDQFARIGAALLSKLHVGAPLPALLAAIYSEGTKAGNGPDHPALTAVLWCMHAIGVRGVRIDSEKGEATFDTVPPNERHDVGDPYSPGNIATGAALMTALLNLQRRKFRLNGEEIDIRMQDPELLKGAMQGITANKRINEPIHFATARTFGGMLHNKMERTDPKAMAIMQLLSDLGTRAMRVDSEKNTIQFEEFSPADAAASAYLQGVDSAGIQQARERLNALVARLNNALKSGAAPAAGPQKLHLKRRRRA